MQPCDRCGAVGVNPCTTPTGRIASSWHKVRVQIVRSPRQIEQAVLVAAAAAPWLVDDVDQAKLELALTLARKVDDSLFRSERKAAGTMFADAPLDEGGGVTYDLDVLGRMLDSLGLSPKGRKELDVEEGAEASDDLDTIIGLTAV